MEKEGDNMISYEEAIKIVCKETTNNKMDIIQVLESDTDFIFSFDKNDMPITVFVDKNKNRFVI